MSDFQTSDIAELLHETVKPVDEEEKAYLALMERDRVLVSGFTKNSHSLLHWPEPVRKKYIR